MAETFYRELDRNLLADPRRLSQIDDQPASQRDLELVPLKEHIFHSRRDPRPALTPSRLGWVSIRSATRPPAPLSAMGREELLEQQGHVLTF
jgi:hypothetical protein